MQGTRRMVEVTSVTIELGNKWSWCEKRLQKKYNSCHAFWESEPPCMCALLHSVQMYHPGSLKKSSNCSWLNPHTWIGCVQADGGHRRGMRCMGGHVCKWQLQLVTSTPAALSWSASGRWSMMVVHDNSKGGHAMSIGPINVHCCVGCIDRSKMWLPNNY